MRGISRWLQSFMVGIIFKPDANGFSKMVLAIRSPWQHVER